MDIELLFMEVKAGKRLDSDCHEQWCRAGRRVYVQWLTRGVGGR
jgi:hypothetical protein